MNNPWGCDQIKIAKHVCERSVKWHQRSALYYCTDTWTLENKNVRRDSLTGIQYCYMNCVRQKRTTTQQEYNTSRNIQINENRGLNNQRTDSPLVLQQSLSQEYFEKRVWCQGNEMKWKWKLMKHFDQSSKWSNQDCKTEPVFNFVRSRAQEIRVLLPIDHNVVECTG